MKWNSAWSVFPGPVILTISWSFYSPVVLLYNLTSFSCINTIFPYYESVWPQVWPQNKCRAQYFMVQWFCHILKSIWCILIKILDYESVWPEVWPQNKCRSEWPIFHGPVLLLYIFKNIWCINIILIYYESVWPKFDLKINVAHSDLVIYLIFWRVFDDVQTSHLWIRSQYNSKFDLKINVDHSDLLFTVQ